MFWELHRIIVNFVDQTNNGARLEGTVPIEHLIENNTQ